MRFWSGTYRIDRDITHVMIYLGRDRRTGEPLMFGAERGGVRVTGFRNDGRGMGRFVGYGRIPGLTGR
ncbi:MAG: hypothetical protein JO317_00125 [Verrucomicrobiae bacterium]|nr:hypothetical protein [Verrucomicrobiae bacterium]